MDNKEENQDPNELTLKYANLIKEFQMKPKMRVFLITSKFLKGLESFPETNKIPKILNSELKNALNSLSTNSNKNKNKKKTKKSNIPQINKDFYPVDEVLWDDLVFNFGGGPEISYYVCDDGTIDYTNFQIMVKCGTEKKCIQTSMKTDLQTFHSLVLNAFGIDKNEKYKLCCNNSPTPIAFEGTVGGRIANEKLLILTVHNPESKKPVQTIKADPIPVKKTNDNSNTEIKSDNSRPLGLKNTGNSCYMNSVVQCFASVDHLKDELNDLRAEADETQATLEHLGPDKNLRGLSAKLHVGQYKTTNAFLSLMTNLKNNTPEKIEDDFKWRPPKSSKGKNKKYMKNMNRNIKFNAHSKMQTAIHLKKSMSLFSNNQQQDAHEFFSFLLDAVHDECPKAIERLFYGKCKRTTTCALCGHESVIVEDFSSLSLPVAMARKVLYSPYDLNKQLQRIQSIPENLSDRVVLIGKTRKGNKVVTKMSPDFIEVIALEIPDLSDSNQNPTSNEDLIISHASSKQENFEIIDGNDGDQSEDSESDNNENSSENEDTEKDKQNENKDDDHDEKNENDSKENDENAGNAKEDTEDKKESNEHDEVQDETQENVDNTNNENDNNNNENVVNKDDENENNNNENVVNNDDENENNNNENVVNKDDENENNNNNENNDDRANVNSAERSGNLQYGVALLRVISKKSNEKTLPLLVKVPLNVQLTEDEIKEIVRERLRPILQQPDCEIKLLAPPKEFNKDDEKPFCRFPLSCHVTSPLKPTRLETLFTKSEIPISIDELLDSFFSKMQLDEDNMWLCDICKNNSCAYQQVHLLDTPNKTKNAQMQKDQSTEETAKTNESKNDQNTEEQAKEDESKIDQNTENQNELHAEEIKNEQENAINNQEKKNDGQNEGEHPENKENDEQKAEVTSTDQEAHEPSNESDDNKNDQDKKEETGPQKTTDHSDSVPANDCKKTFHLPECLVLHLKRFIAKNGRLSRDPTTVVIPHYINISRFIERNPEQENIDDNNYTYKLVAVSNHAGSLQGGHYTAYGERDGKWYTFNDTVVSANNNIFGEKSNDRFGSSNAYLLFYSRVEQ